MYPGRIIGFVPARDLKKAKTFYHDVLALPFLSEDEFALVFDAHGIKLRVTKIDHFTPQPFTILGWEVQDIRKAASELEAKGVRFERYGMNGQDERGIWTAPGGSLVAWLKDPDGNVLSLTQFPT